MAFVLPTNSRREDTDGPDKMSWPMSVPSLRGLAILCFVMAMAATAGCASTPDPDPPELSASIDATNARLQSLEAFETSIRSDLNRLEMMGEDLETLADYVANSQLPLSLLRLVALNCLNSAYDGDVLDSGILETTPLTCEPAHADRLVQALKTASTADRDRAHELLYLVDQTRHLRGSIRRRMSRLADSANDHLDFIADERAMLRQTQADLEQNRNLYSSTGWEEATGAVDEHRERLDELASRIEELAEDYRTWGPRIDDIVSHVYFELSYLRADGRGVNSTLGD